MTRIKDLTKTGALERTLKKLVKHKAMVTAIPPSGGQHEVACHRGLQQD